MKQIEREVEKNQTSNKRNNKHTILNSNKRETKSELNGDEIII